jgi:hypothetical protein
MRHYGGGGRHYGGGYRGGRHYGGGYRGGRHYGGGVSRHYRGGKHYSGKHYGHGHRNYYRRGYGWGYWRSGVWIATGIVGYGVGSYCSQLYYYDYERWLYECQ